MRKLAILGVMLLLSGCGSSTTAPTMGTGNSVAIPSGAYLGTGITFTPQTLTLSAGTTVVWTNSDSVAHTSVADGGTWASPNINPGATFSVQLNTPGTYTYHCIIHPFMTGTLIVQ